MRPTAPAPCGRKRATPLFTRRARLPRAALATLALLAVGACAKSDGMGPDATEQVDKPPTVTGVAVKNDAKVYLRAGLTASASDPEGKMGDVVIDWGDGQTTTLTSDFNAISRTHDYSESGSYTVTVTATDAGGNRASGNATLKLDEIPQPCIDVLKIIGGCAKIQPDYKGVTVEVKVLDVKVNSFTLSTTNNHVAIPVFAPVVVGFVPYPMGQLVTDASFSRTKGSSYLRFRVQGCLWPGNCPATALDKRVAW